MIESMVLSVFVDGLRLVFNDRRSTRSIVRFLNATTYGMLHNGPRLWLLLPCVLRLLRLCVDKRVHRGGGGGDQSQAPGGAAYPEAQAVLQPELCRQRP